jgi:hypothetical protein
MIQLMQRMDSEYVRLCMNISRQAIKRNRYINCVGGTLMEGATVMSWGRVKLGCAYIGMRMGTKELRA